MTSKEFVNSISVLPADGKKVKRIEKKYGLKLPEELSKIVSNCDDGVFFDDEIRILSFSEILNAQKDLKVKFKKSKLLPVFDCMDNNFIVFNYNENENNWAKYNIVDETLFTDSKPLLELIV